MNNSKNMGGNDHLTKAEIAECPHFKRDIASEPSATIEQFLSTLADEAEHSVFTVIQAMNDYLAGIRQSITDQLIADHGGEAIGLELEDKDGRLACIFPEPSNRGGYRVSFYDATGPYSHDVFVTEREAVKAAVDRHHRSPAPGKLDSLTELPTWKRGMKWISLLIQTNGNPFPFLAANPGYLDEAI